MSDNNLSDMIKMYKEKMIKLSKLNPNIQENIKKPEPEQVNDQENEEDPAPEEGEDNESIEDNNQIEEVIYQEKIKNSSKNNLKTGILKVHVTAANGAFPIKDARVVISKKNNNNKITIFYDLKTDIDGIVDNIVLYAHQDTTLPEESPYITYNVTVTHPDFRSVTNSTANMLEGQKSILLVTMIPN